LKESLIIGIIEELEKLVEELVIPLLREERKEKK